MGAERLGGAPKKQELDPRIRQQEGQRAQADALQATGLVRPGAADYHPVNPQADRGVTPLVSLRAGMEARRGLR